MIRGRTVLVLLAAGVIAACASSGSKPSVGSGGNGGSIGSDAGGAAGNGGSGAVSGGGGIAPDAAPDAGGDTGQPEASPDGNADTTQPDATPDTGSDASSCHATSLGNCGTSLVCTPLDKCHSLYTGTGVRDWPIDADATGPASDAGGNSCTDSKSNDWPSEGPGSATWFIWGSCGTYKTYPVSAGCAFDILSYNDCCPGCQLENVDIAVQEKVNGVWTTQTTISHPFNGSCQHWDDIYVPKTSQVRLLHQGSMGSYVCVFQQ